MLRLLTLFATLLALPAVGFAVSRSELPLVSGWHFRLGDAPAADPGPGQLVDLPHTWNAIDCTSPSMVRGRGWYSLDFKSPETRAGDRVYLCFEGVSQLCTVWLNGQPVGSHDGAFSAFRFDVTEALATGPALNHLVVLADSSWNDAVPPREGDFAVCGGIYRPVHLLVTGAVAIDPLDLASPGVWLTTPVVGPDKATLDARIRIRNATAAARPVVVRLELLDEAGMTVAAVESPHSALAGVGEARLALELASPHLWQGVSDPYLYSARISLRAGGSEIDSVTQPVGFRTFAVDPQKGFLLNGRPYDLHGVNLHQDREGKGWAISEADREQDFRLIADLGATFVRLAHYQHADQAYALADRLGLVVWAENALVNTVSTDPRFTQRCVTQLEELIRQNRNHPSIAFWSIANEVQVDKPGALPLLQALARVAHLEDPSRLSTVASFYPDAPATYGTDVIGYNQYHGWYHDKASDFAPWIDARHAEYPGQCLGLSEYGAGAGVSLHSPTPVALDHSEEYQCLFHETYWAALSTRPWIWCKTVWAMFDFASPWRKEGERPGINDKGLATRDRRTLKDAYYFYQAQWSPRPMVHITGRRFSPRPQGAAELKVYTNAPRVSLSLDGMPLGEIDSVGGVARWPGVVLTPGRHELSATAKRNGTTVTDACTLEVAPPAAR